MVISKMAWKQMYFVIFFRLLGNQIVLFFTIQNGIASFTPEYSKVPSLFVLDGCSGVLRIL